MVVEEIGYFLLELEEPKGLFYVLGGGEFEQVDGLLLVLFLDVGDDRGDELLLEILGLEGFPAFGLELALGVLGGLGDFDGFPDLLEPADSDVVDDLLEHALVDGSPLLEHTYHFCYLREEVPVDGLHVHLLEHDGPLHMDILALGLQEARVDVPEYFEEFVHEDLVGSDLVVHCVDEELSLR